MKLAATFFERVARSFMEAGWLRLDFLEIGGRAVASTFSFEPAGALTSAALMSRTAAHASIPSGVIRPCTDCTRCSIGSRPERGSG